MKSFLLSLLGLTILGLAACRSKPASYVILMGAAMTPKYDEILINETFGGKKHLMVTGQGSMGLTEYGSIQIKTSSGERMHFKSGGIMINQLSGVLEMDADINCVIHALVMERRDEEMCRVIEKFLMPAGKSRRQIVLK